MVEKKKPQRYMPVTDKNEPMAMNLLLRFQSYRQIEI